MSRAEAEGPQEQVGAEAEQVCILDQGEVEALGGSLSGLWFSNSPSLGQTSLGCKPQPDRSCHLTDKDLLPHTKPVKENGQSPCLLDTLSSGGWGTLSAEGGTGGHGRSC